MNQMPQATALEQPAGNLPSPSRQRAYAASRHDKWFKPRKEAVKSEEGMALVVRTFNPRFVERVWAEQHDSHVRLYVRRLASPAKAYLIDRCVEMDMTFDDLTRPKRTHKMVAIRDRLVFEVYTKFEMSVAQMGDLFQRDHTSLLHSLRKFGVRAGDRRRTAESCEDEIKAMWEGGASQMEIAVATGFDQSGICRLIQKKGWTR